MCSLSSDVAAADRTSVTLCMTLHQHYTLTLVFEKSSFTLRRIHHFLFGQRVSQPPSSCFLLSVHPFFRNKNYMIAKTLLPFPGSLSSTSRSSKSFLLISSTILPSSHWEAKMSTIAFRQQQVQTAHYPFFPLYRSLSEANVAWQEHVMNVNRAGWVGNSAQETSCVHHRCYILKIISWSC